MTTDEPTTLPEEDREALRDWWDSDWPDTAAGAMGTLYEVVERIVARERADAAAAAREQALREAADEVYTEARWQAEKARCAPVTMIDNEYARDCLLMVEQILHDRAAAIAQGRENAR